MRFAIIKDGRVENITEGDGPLDDDWVADDGTAHIGSVWDGHNFHLPPNAHPVVPRTVSRRQARQALLLQTKGDGSNLLDAVPAAIEAIPDATVRRLAQIEWEDSQVFERDRPLVHTLGAALGLSSAQVDELFIAASQL